MVATLAPVTVHTGLVPGQNCPDRTAILAIWRCQIARNVAALTPIQQRTRGADYCRTTYERRRAAGRCVACNVPVTDGGARCPFCRAYHRRKGGQA